MVHSDVSSKKNDVRVMNLTFQNVPNAVPKERRVLKKCLSVVSAKKYICPGRIICHRKYCVCASVQTLNCKYPSVHADIGNKNASLFEFCTAGRQLQQYNTGWHQTKWRNTKGCRLAVRALERKRFSSLALAADCIYVHIYACALTPSMSWRKVAKYKWSGALV